MTVRKLRQDDVMGFLDERLLPIAVRSIFVGAHSERFLVQRYHTERGIKPDPEKAEEKS